MQKVCAYRRCPRNGVPFDARRSDALYCSSGCRARANEAKHGRSAHSRSRGHTGGVQVSYTKAISACIEAMQLVTYEWYRFHTGETEGVPPDREIAERYMREALPARQRARLP